MMKIALLAPLLWVVLSSAQAETVTLDKTIKAGGEMTLSFRCDGGKVELFRNENNDCHAWVEYDQKRCHTELNYDDDTRTLELFIDHDNWEMTKKSGDEKSKYARVRIGLPSKADLNLDLVVKAGELKMTLGDLHIQSLEVRSYAGESHIDFDKPNRCELKTFDVDFKVGKVQLVNLGNANFSEADINSSVGEMSIDFNGEKIRHAMARVDLEIGETTIIVPEDIGVKVKVSKFLFLSNVDYPNWFTQEGSYYYSRNYEKEKDSLYLVVSTGIGTLKMRVDKREDH
ncbi:MAG TPA: LiaF-related protein [bacterium]|nr:LiaF-related protein [bacterium]HQG44888.1 LiaF-related protein [bacterium]HQI49215.1 LiaF-related protein [bacterium]HQJ63632.1 LiaF-related protein [bacterium]